MDDDVLNRYASRLGARAGEPAAADLDVGDDLGCFGWLRGGRDRAVSLVLHKKSGNSLALSYGFIERMEFDPSDGITITAGRATVRILGQNLDTEIRPTVRLFEGLTRSRVPWVRESSGSAVWQGASDTCLIEAISWS